MNKHFIFLCVLGGMVISLVVKDPVTVLTFSALYGAALGVVHGLFLQEK